MGEDFEKRISALEQQVIYLNNTNIEIIDTLNNLIELLENDGDKDVK